MDLIFPNAIGKLMDGICTGWALGYAIVVAELTALAAFGWFLLTGKPIHTLGRGIGVVMVSYVACELFRLAEILRCSGHAGREPAQSTTDPEAVGVDREDILGQRVQLDAFSHLYPNSW